ncbi:hypothetical protein CsatB_017445 [Cannabis sativa]
MNDIEALPRLSSAGISASSPVDRLSSLPLVIHDCKGTSERSMFKTKWVLFGYEIDERLNDVDKSILLFALNFHAEKDDKIGVGAQDIKVAYHKEHENSRCFMLVRVNESSQSVLPQQPIVINDSSWQAPVRSWIKFNCEFNCDVTVGRDSMMLAVVAKNSDSDVVWVETKSLRFLSPIGGEAAAWSLTHQHIAIRLSFLFVVIECDCLNIVNAFIGKHTVRYL